jgi:hypothetical protein
MKDGISVTSRDQGHVLMLGMQTQFKHTGGVIAHQLDRAESSPSMN